MLRHDDETMCAGGRFDDHWAVGMLSPSSVCDLRFEKECP
jgi:hypothetical protein